MKEMSKDNKEIICYDVMIMPHNFYVGGKKADMADIIYMAKEYGYMFYDSSGAPQNPHPYPYILSGKDEMPHILVDVSTLEGKEKLKEVKQKMKDT
jgi:hypothetical protein